MALITERYATELAGVVSCFDRVVMHGTLPIFCHAEGMSRYLSARGIRIVDSTAFVKPLTDSIKANAEALAGQAGLTIDLGTQEELPQRG